MINFGIFLLTGVALWVATLQARDARTQRDAADTASAAAAQHEAAALEAARRSASASERVAREQARAADALEKQVALSEFAAQKTDPWLLEALSPSNMDQRWRIENCTGDTALSVKISGPWIDTVHEIDQEVGPGMSTYFTFIRRLSSPSHTTVMITWFLPSGTHRKFTKHIGDSEAI